MRRRRVGVWSLAATIFFVVSGGPYSTEPIVGKSGPLFALLVLALLPFIWSLPVGLMTAELSSRFPQEGGYFVWVENAFGPFAGFLCAWWSWASSWVDLALYPLIAVQYLARICGPLPHIHWLVAAVILILCGWNMLGIKHVGTLSSALMIVLMIPFLGIVGVGFHRWVMDPPHLVWLNQGASAGGVGAALVLALWNYFGWDSLSTTLGEIEDAARIVPRAIFRAVTLVSVLVVLPVAAGIAISRDWGKWNNESGYWPEIAALAWPGMAAWVIVGGVISNVGQFSANLLASSRVPYVLAQKRFLPQVFARELPKMGTPWAAIALSGVVSALLAKERFEKLVAVDLSLYLVALMLECGALLRLGSKSGALPGTFQIGWGRAGLLLCAILPIALGLLAIGLQLSPSGQVSEEVKNPIAIFAVLLGSGPIMYALRSKFA